jgi:hypothetical protein
MNDQWIDKLAGGFVLGVFAVLIAWLFERYGITGEEKPKKDNEGKKGNKLKVNCPKCSRRLKGATQEMIGDIGVCPKCKAEFVIEQKQ